MSLKYKNPPISELVIATYFNPPLFQLHAEHIGLFWSRIRKNYPNISQQPPLGTFIDAPGDIFPLPRFWIISKNDATLMQIQKNAFIFNWRKRDEEYPHYNTVKSEFDRFYLEFADFLKSEVDTPDIGIEVCELTYINIITESDYWKTVADTMNVIPSFKPIDIGFDGCASNDFTYITVHQLDEQLSLKVTIQTVHLAEKPEESHLKFELRATGRLGKASKSDADIWFNRAHDAIGHCFKSVTNPDIQKKYWKPIEEA